MNKYRTTPGLGPSKATASTTCQKCLAKGHYSYECKASLQSRPYTSRASRTEQLRNPKLKPALAETKMAEPAVDPTGQPPNPRGTGVGDGRGRSRSLSHERPIKRRRRSVSSSSTSSVSTISTEASTSDHDTARPRSPSPRPGRNSRARSRSRTPLCERREPSSSRSRSRPRFGRFQAARPSCRQDLRPNGENPDKASDSFNRRQGGRRSRSPRRRTISRSPERDRNRQTDSGQSKSYRQRSLSPFSKRLALTQAMNTSQHF